jgi:hypothetical protein
MPLATLTTLKNAIGGGVRPNMFRVTVLGNQNIQTLCKATSLPGSTIGTIEVPMSGGRRYKLGGDRTFAEWSMTVLLDESYALRRLFENTQRAYVATDYDTVVTGNRSATSNFVNVKVEQLNETNTSIRTYELKNAFISDISTIDLSYDSTDAISEYTVTWVYDYFVTA